ncbi:MAG: site-specific DNA-methyltransferase [bacterium]|nr:site-specific DNA-methyltransferase [bacterium]
MAKIEDLIDQIEDPSLREQVASEVKELKKTKQFGLVFEEHIPETVSVFGYPVRSGQIVQNRTTPDDLSQFRVLKVEDGVATVIPRGTDGPEAKIPVKDLLVVKQFHEQVFCGLTPVGNVRRGGPEKPAHVVINGENFHALQVLTYAYAGKVDCIYIDPPYNTGDKSWKYNNRFVDENDRYRHSKWLSFMEKRLRLARHLLKPDGVLVVTIDEHEVHHLGVLLDEMFPDAYHQMVTIMNNPKGVTQPRFSRVEEYAHFVFFGEAVVESRPDDLFTFGGDTAGEKQAPGWKSLLRGGAGALPSDRPNMVYPIAIDPEKGRIVDAGESLKERGEQGLLDPSEYDFLTPEVDLTIGGLPVAWPIRRDKSLGRWNLGRDKLLYLAQHGLARLGKFDPERRTWAISYLSAKLQDQLEAGLLEVVSRNEDTGVLSVRYVGARDRRIKTMWHRSRHDAGTGGTKLLGELLGGRQFDFPKSLYAVRDTLDALVVSKPDAVILDFFAGSGTALHATALLNAQDGGRRQCVLVTNNEVNDRDAKSLAGTQRGVFKGDAEFEAKGIFEAVTKPRCETAIKGIRSDGTRPSGKYPDRYLSDHNYEDGFEENVEFLRLDYLDPDLVELGRHFNAVVPILWMASGSVGEFEEWDGDAPWSLPDGSTYGVLFDEQHLAQFTKELESRPSVTHVWLVTNSEAGFIEMCQALPEHLQVRRLYWDYSRNFTVNGPGVLG